MNFTQNDTNIPSKKDINKNKKQIKKLIKKETNDDTSVNIDVYKKSCKASDKKILGVDDVGNCVVSDDHKRIKDVEMQGGKYYYNNKNTTKNVSSDSIISNKDNVIDAIQNVNNFDYKIPNTDKDGKLKLNILENCLNKSNYSLMGIFGDSTELMCVLYDNTKKEIKNYDINDFILKFK